MMSTMFERTRPIGSPELMRVSEFRRYLQDLSLPPSTVTGDGTRLRQVGTLGPSLMADLRRSRNGDAHEPLEVLAACVRHGTRVTVHLQCGSFALPLTIYPTEQTVHCGAGQLDFLYTQIQDVSLLWVEAAAGPVAGSTAAPFVGDAAEAVPLTLAAAAPAVTPATTAHPLGPVLWQLAIRGLRASLLSDIAGPAVYRLAPGLDLSRLVLGNAEAAAVYRLRREAATARAMADWPGFDRLRVTYLLNALYLQAGLIVSRSHPRAIRDSWFSALGPR
jgi:hypothetical protein